MREVREEALGWTWRVSRTGRRHGVALRVLPDGTEQELATSSRLLGLDRVGLAGAVLFDATGEEASHRLATDLAAFLVPYEIGEQEMGGEELRDWLETWRTPFEKVFSTRGFKRSGR